MQMDYDIHNPGSIEAYARGLIGHSFRWVQNIPCPFPDPKGGRGALGVLIEEHYFQYRANSNREPDLGSVELKSTPYEILKSGGIKAGERLVLTMIDYSAPVVYDFYKSHLWQKCRLLLLIIYLRDRNADENLDYIIRFVKLFTPPETDLQIILEDYRYIVEKLAAGLAHELSESQTKYLGACTKGATAATSWVNQYYSHNGVIEKAKKRAFCFKQPYMTFVLNTYIVGRQSNCEQIFHNVDEFNTVGFEPAVTACIDRFKYKTDKQIAHILGVSTKAKNFWSILTFRMLGVKSNNAEEFVKAGIVVKTIRIEENGRMEQHMSFPALSFCRLANDEWEDSEIYGLFGRTLYLFVVYRKFRGEYQLMGSEFWCMPSSDLNGAVYDGWKQMRNVVSNGVVLTKTTELTSNGNPKILNNLPGLADNPIIHLRPHTRTVYYKLNDGTEFGDPANGDRLPSGEWMTRQSCWLHKDYVLSQLTNDLKGCEYRK